MIGGSGVAQWTTDQTCACVRQAHREVEAKFRAAGVVKRFAPSTTNGDDGTPSASRNEA